MAAMTPINAMTTSSSTSVMPDCEDEPASCAAGAAPSLAGATAAAEGGAA